MRTLFAIAALLLSVGASAQEWRAYAGGFGSRWNTTGHHGHDHDQCPAGCDPDDFLRANLDDSIGFRAGLERDVWRAGGFRIVAGADASVSHTEYNSSQRDFSFVSAALFAGTDYDFGRARIGARYGAGGYTTTSREHAGYVRFLDLGAELPLRRGAAVRLSRRQFVLTRMNGQPSRDLSVTFVTTDRGERDSLWEFTAATGTALPGAGAGGDRKLRGTVLNRTAASRAFGDMQLELSWTSTAHESSLPSVFRGYDGNFRSKTIEAYGVGVARIQPLTRRLALRWSGGMEIADWRDEYRLLTRNGKELVAGVELGATAGAALRMQLRPHIAFETALQKVYWRDLDLSELRCAAGIVLTR